MPEDRGPPTFYQPLPNKLYRILTEKRHVRIGLDICNDARAPQNHRTVAQAGAHAVRSSSNMSSETAPPYAPPSASTVHAEAAHVDAQPLPVAAAEAPAPAAGAAHVDAQPPPVAAAEAPAPAAGAADVDAQPPGNDLYRSLLHIVKTRFGFSRFRPLQADIMIALMRGNDVTAFMPTSAGKSLCFQVPALLAKRPVVVCSPLLSLIQVSRTTPSHARARPSCASSPSLPGSSGLVECQGQGCWISELRRQPRWRAPLGSEREGRHGRQVRHDLCHPGAPRHGRFHCQAALPA